MLIDTGSSPSWVQCEGRRSCFPLNGTGNFKYTQSQSFRRLPCNNSLCTPKFCDERGYCRYNAKYLRSSSQGVVLTDTFTFPTDSRTTTAKYPNLAFGCGLTNENLSFGKDNNKIAGIMGLGLEKKSILVQLEYQTKRRFSYCLSQLDTPTSLHFGDDAKINRTIRTVQGTRLVPGSSNYFVCEVLGICIGNYFVFRSFSDSRTCLAMLRVNERGPNIFHRFVFDGGRYMIAFAPENCA